MYNMKSLFKCLLVVAILPLLLSCERDVQQITKEATLEVKTTELHLKIGETKKIDFTVSPSEERKKVVFQSSDTRIAEVNEEGAVQALAAGQCAISISLGKLTKQVKVTVDEPDTHQFAIVQLLSYKPTETPPFTYKEIAGNRLEIPYFGHVYLLAMYDGEILNAHKGVQWKSGSSDLLMTKEDKDIGGFSVDANCTVGETTVSARYGDMEASITIAIESADNVFTKMYDPFLKWSASAEEVSDWEKKNGGELLSKKEINMGEVDLGKNFLYEFNVQSEDGHLFRRAYIINEKSGMSVAYSAIKPLHYAYEIQKEGDIITYFPKDAFLGLLNYAHCEGISLKFDGSGTIKTIRKDDNGQVVGIRIYPDQTDLDDQGFAQSLIIEYNEISDK